MRYPMKSAFVRLSQNWSSSFKPNPTFITKRSLFSLDHLQHRLTNNFKFALATTGEFLRSLRAVKSTDQQRIEQKDNRFSEGIDLSGSPSKSRHAKPSLRDFPLSLDETIIMFRQEAAVRKKKFAKIDAEMLENARRADLKRNSPKSSATNPHKEPHSPRERKPLQSLPPTSPAARTLKMLDQIRKENRAIRQKREVREEMEKRRLGEERRLALRKAYRDRYKLILDRPRRVPRVVGRMEVLRRMEAQRTKESFQEWMARKAVKKPIVYDRWKQKAEWEVEWEKKRTPPVCGKRKREFSIIDYMAEPRPRRRKLNPVGLVPSFRY